MLEKKKCFVVMGFGEKTDYLTSRVLDMDKTFKYIIKPAVLDAVLECISADEIPPFRHYRHADVRATDADRLPGGRSFPFVPQCRL